MKALARPGVSLLVLLLTVTLATLVAAARDPERRRFPDPIHGITISTHRDGRDWARSETLVPTLRDIKSLGAGWVAIHPYAGIRGDGTVRFRTIDPESPPAHVVGPIRNAHRLGLKILIKPHLAYWGSPFDWRGDIDFDEPEEWARFWSGYASWIEQLAAVSGEADGFVVGTELDRTLEHDTAWRDLIARVRAHTSAPLTYAANWTDYRRVPFWDALDAIGIQAYFPLVDEPTTAEDALMAGWSRRMGELREFARKQRRPVLFTELGYSRSPMAPVTPWVPGSDGPSYSALQELCMRVALAAVRDEPLVLGAFLWKWFPEPDPVGRNFELATPGMRRVIGDAWGEPETGMSAP
jgi:hypothetical protein